MEIRACPGSLNYTQSISTQRSLKTILHGPVTCRKYCSVFEYHIADHTKLQWNIDQTKEYIKPFHYKGATGLKVKLNALPPEISKEKSIAQIASSLNEVGKFAVDYDKLIRVGAHARNQ